MAGSVYLKLLRPLVKHSLIIQIAGSFLLAEGGGKGIRKESVRDPVLIFAVMYMYL